MRLRGRVDALYKSMFTLLYFTLLYVKDKDKDKDQIHKDEDKDKD